MELLLLLVGFVPLILGAQALVDGASSLAARFRVPPLVIGLTIVAFGTSAPELVVNVFSATRGSTDLALGNIVGSNIFNALGILGLAALVSPLAVQRSTTRNEIPLAGLAGLVVFVMGTASWWDAGASNLITRTDGLLLLGFFVIFLWYSAHLAAAGEAPSEAIAERSAWLSVLLVVGGLAGLVLGGKLIADNAADLARAAGWAERTIGLTIVAIGTSLPELATSLVAAFRKKADIAVGNVIGSNIFNIFFILGVTATVTPVPVSAPAQVDMLVNLVASAFLFLFVFTGRGRAIGRVEGGFLVVLYAAYTAWLLAS